LREAVKSVEEQKVTPSERPRPKHKYCPLAQVLAQLAVEKFATAGARIGRARSVQRQPVCATSPALFPPVRLLQAETKGRASIESEFSSAVANPNVDSSRYAKPELLKGPNA